MNASYCERPLSLVVKTTYENNFYRDVIYLTNTSPLLSTELPGHHLRNGIFENGLLRRYDILTPHHVLPKPAFLLL